MIIDKDFGQTHHDNPNEVIFRPDTSEQSKIHNDNTAEQQKNDEIPFFQIEHFDSPSCKYNNESMHNHIDSDIFFIK